MKFIGEDDQEYVADESGSVVPMKDMEQTVPESDSGSMEPASDQSAIMGNAQQV